ncbi:MAG: hypothetical protein LBG72_09580 [Spirochaetaceae bacterium]|nr:hypothetical protein [Spirochaetaceae bacterium]
MKKLFALLMLTIPVMVFADVLQDILDEFEAAKKTIRNELTIVQQKKRYIEGKRKWTGDDLKFLLADWLEYIKPDRIENVWGNMESATSKAFFRISKLAFINGQHIITGDRIDAMHERRDKHIKDMENSISEFTEIISKISYEDNPASGMVKLIQSNYDCLVNLEYELKGLQELMDECIFILQDLRRIFYP